MGKEGPPRKGRIVTIRQIAAVVPKTTHFIHWTYDGELLTSPPIPVGGHLRVVRIGPSKAGSLFPLVEVVPGGAFYSLNPLGWPSIVLSLAQKQFKIQQQLQALLARNVVSGPLGR